MVSDFSASHSGGKILPDLLAVTFLSETTNSCGAASLNKDQSSAIVALTNGVAKLLPLNFLNPPPAEVLVIFMPGAINPCFAIEGLIFDTGSGIPSRSHATTGMIQG